MNYIPKKGDVIWLNFNPQTGHEQSSRRPALVLSPEAYNQRVGLALLCPITKQSKGYPFEVFLPENLTVEGVILADQVKSLDWQSRKAVYICTLPVSVVNEVLEKLKTLLANMEES
jgi:mRNA interferase MazF